MKEKWVKKYNEMNVEKRYKETNRGWPQGFPERSTKEQSKQVKVKRNNESEYE